MKTSTSKATAYESPECRVIAIETEALICTSPDGQTETYDLEDTTGWYNNI